MYTMHDQLIHSVGYERPRMHCAKRVDVYPYVKTGSLGNFSFV